jgi:hypothetical protein
MREAAKIQAPAATGSADAQSAALAREVNELKEAVGEATVNDTHKALNE